MNIRSVAAVVSLSLVGGVLAGCGSSTPPSGATLRRVQAAVDRDDDKLGRQGIFVSSTGGGPGCARVNLLNPTRQNVEYIRQHYGPNACVPAEPGPIVTACAGSGHKPKPGDHVVPDVVGKDFEEATGTLTNAGYRFAAYCPGQGARKPHRVTQGDIEQFATIARQCPAAGTRTAAGEVVGIEAVVVLPGGYRHTIAPDICNYEKP